MTEKIFQATRDFSAEYYGRRVEIHGGQSRVAPGHELVQRFPDCFEEIDVTGGPGVRDLFMDQRTRTVEPIRVVEGTNPTPVAPWGPPSSVSAAAPGGVPHLRSWPSPFAVRIAPGVYSSLRDAGSDRDGLERGGFLLGEREDGGLRIFHFSQERPGDQRSSNSIVLDTDRAESIEAQLGPSQQIVGKWHSHPSGGTQPSTADLESMAAGLDYRRLDAYASLIFTPDSYHGSRATAYIARRNGDHVVAEPAVIEEGYSWQ